MKPDRMTAFEAPRVALPGRVMRDIELRYRGHVRDGGTRETVRIPHAMPLPDLISYHGHTFIKRTDAMYSEGTMWPVLDELDGR
jgi:hypothetical protein